MVDVLMTESLESISVECTVILVFFMSTCWYYVSEKIILMFTVLQLCSFFHHDLYE